MKLIHITSSYRVHTIVPLVILWFSVQSLPLLMATEMVWIQSERTTEKRVLLRFFCHKFSIHTQQEHVGINLTKSCFSSDSILAFFRVDIPLNGTMTDLRGGQSNKGTVSIFIIVLETQTIIYSLFKTYLLCGLWGRLCLSTDSPQCGAY